MWLFAVIENALQEVALTHSMAAAAAAAEHFS